MSPARLAPAKVNLFLHVGATQPDGYHPVASWIAFADVGDRLSLEPAAAWSFEAHGPFADDIGAGENLVERAAARLFERAGAAPPAARLALEKRLPVAAGLGGGSSDAGAALRLLNATAPRPLPESALMEIAAELGADGPACLHGEPVLARGRGDVLGPAPRTPPLPAVLVNPRRPSPTGDVYRAYDVGRAARADMPDLPASFSGVWEVVAALQPLRNDLEAPASRLEPEIAEVLAWLGAQLEVLLARMSGSGATCFALCQTRDAAARLAARAARDRPAWWAVDCNVGSFTKP